MFAKLQHRALQAAQLFLVGIFFCFPVSLAATNILMAIMLIAWLLAGQFKTRWQSVQNNHITLPALMLYAWSFWVRPTARPAAQKCCSP